MHPVKALLARSFELSRLSDALLAMQRVRGPGFARAVNYHGVAPDMAGAFEEHLEFYAERFEPLGYEQMLELHAGRWRGSKPGIVLTFDDGLWSHAHVVAPLLDRFGFTGWFFVPSGLIGGASDQWQEANLSWAEVRALAERHVVGCHTMLHNRLSADLTAEQLDLEIRQSKLLLEEKLSRPTDVFCWVGGEEWSYSSGAAAAIRDTGYRLSFMTNNSLIWPQCNLLQLQRTNVEASFPLHVVKFQLCGLMDLLYLPKRRRVNRLTA
jgi:peptidoglycan/xylan/chitin deacetylase (PgdA/CDA1 family)